MIIIIIVIIIILHVHVLLQLYLCSKLPIYIARGKVTPTGSKLEGGPSTGPGSSAHQSDESTRVKEKEREERKAAKKLKKELQNAEAQGAVPLGPLVALGKPRDKLKKRPRCDISWNNNNNNNDESLLYNFMNSFLLFTVTPSSHCLILYVFEKCQLFINQ